MLTHKHTAANELRSSMSNETFAILIRIALIATLIVVLACFHIDKKESTDPQHESVILSSEASEQSSKSEVAPIAAVNPRSKYHFDKTKLPKLVQITQERLSDEHTFSIPVSNGVQTSAECKQNLKVNGYCIISPNLLFADSFFRELMMCYDRSKEALEIFIEEQVSAPLHRSIFDAFLKVEKIIFFGNHYPTADSIHKDGNPRGPYFTIRVWFPLIHTKYFVAIPKHIQFDWIDWRKLRDPLRAAGELEQKAEISGPGKMVIFLSSITGENQVQHAAIEDKLTDSKLIEEYAHNRGGETSLVIEYGKPR